MKRVRRSCVHSFYDFPDDPKTWEIEDQYMFGSDILVAPILYADERESDALPSEGKLEASLYRRGVRRRNNGHCGSTAGSAAGI